MQIYLIVNNLISEYLKFWKIPVYLPRTLKKWLVPFEKELWEKQGRFYQIPQVKIIFEKRSLPSEILIEA